jgi:hypothetical protein
MAAAPTSNGGASQFSPDDMALVPADKPLVFRWPEVEKAALYQLRIEDMRGNAVVSALLLPAADFYEAPPWVRESARREVLRWKVLAFDSEKRQLDETAWRSLRVGP